MMKNYAEEDKFLSQPRKRLISSFTIQNGTLITLLLLLYSQLSLVSTKTHRFVEYTPKKCFNSFVQSAVDARRQGEGNPQFKCRRGNNEASSQQLLRLPDHGQELTHCNEVSQ